MTSNNYITRFSSRLFGSRKPWPSLDFSSVQYPKVTANQLIEEECLPDYLAERYYPIRIGQVFASRYQVVGKLGFGVTSTVWLARDLRDYQHIALKVFIRSNSLGDEPSRELVAYQRLEAGPKSHLGRQAVRRLLDAFTISGPDGEHQCLVHPPLWGSVRDLLALNSVDRLSPAMLSGILQRLLHALDYARECQVIHTDIQDTNIMFELSSQSVLEEHEKMELQEPMPRKEVDGRYIYQSRSLSGPGHFERIGLPLLCDFGSAAKGEELHYDYVQPTSYRAPEVILQVPWSYEVDVWNVGCLIWDIFEGRTLFVGIDPDYGSYRGRDHLAEIAAVLGPPSLEFLNRGARTPLAFTEQGEFKAHIKVPSRTRLSEMEGYLDEPQKTQFLHFMSKMLQWDPNNRESPAQLLRDPWLQWASDAH